MYSGVSTISQVVRIVKTCPTDFALFALEAGETLTDAGPDARGVVLADRETDRCGKKGSIEKPTLQPTLRTDRKTQMDVDRKGSITITNDNIINVRRTVIWVFSGNV